MITFLFSGWTLTVISISVVFSALIILYGLYSLMSWVVQKASNEAEEQETCVPKQEDDDLIAAAIALSLEMEGKGSVHDIEPGFITINTNNGRGWNDKSLSIRKTIR